ncbi:hypothetical protein ACGC1H_007579 [Rhizoctonia solani]
MKDPRFSPINVSFSLLPEHILIVVCEEDALRDEAVEYGKRLKAEGIKVAVKEMTKIVHYWDKWAKIGEGIPNWYRKARNISGRGGYAEFGLQDLLMLVDAWQHICACKWHVTCYGI